MQNNRSVPPSTVVPTLAYADVRQAAEWLCRAFGFTERLRIADHRAQLTFGDGNVIVTERRTDTGPLPREYDPDTAPALPWRSHGVRVRVEDIDAHFARAIAAGARVINALQDHMYGDREYCCEDLGGHRWTFAQTVMDVDPSDWGGELVG